ncbi:MULTISPECIES: phosphosulfolactate synthase [unclassified Legionella]|uniref:phosphosulfolactate synthase n=1 Tax=unclassified Legionella TaxID=2622702 RepID=UPI001054CED9|nr:MULTISPECIES: phosphosulfolactate synthase [unclassified Legionella]MDI9818024.1 phosphosulfolactate synthase [Legionella sp. PL877]
MNTMFEFINEVPRSTKKRENGITSVIDTGLGLKALEDLLDIAAEYIDLVKFGFGTAVILPREILEKKITRLQQKNCEACLGGTLFEIAEKQGSFTKYLKTCKLLGLNYVEISDGALPMNYQRKLDCIKQASDFGFKVLSEVGSKDPELDKAIGIEEKITMVNSELQAGSWKVIIEARESGTVGLFNRQGKINDEQFVALTSKLASEQLIFESPKKSQQAWLINQLGANVNLGNIAPEDVISLESLRQQLRADTLCQ